MGSRYGLEIRSAGEADAADLAALLAAAGLPLGASDLAARLTALRGEGAVVLVAVEWGPPSGLVALRRHHTLAAARPVAEIDLLLVEPEARRRGIGRLLLKAAAQTARQAGCAQMRLSVGPDAPELAAFCAASGFAARGTVYERALRKGARSSDG